MTLQNSKIEKEHVNYAIDFSIGLLSLGAFATRLLLIFIYEKVNFQ